LNLMVDFAEMARSVGTLRFRLSGFSAISCSIFSKGFPKTSMWSRARVWKDSGNVRISFEDTVRVLFKVIN